jgi:hypothetical protein
VSYTSAFKKITSPKKVLALGSAALSALAVARVLVLLVEAYVTVRDERVADAELIELCSSGSARYSSDFRALCLKKQSELAAPLVFKALLRAFTTAFADFSELFNSPGRIAMLILFGITGISAPVAKALVALLMQNLKQRKRGGREGKYSTSDSESDDDDGQFRIVHMGPPALTRGNSRRRIGHTVRRSIRRLAMAASSDPRIEEIDDL